MERKSNCIFCRIVSGELPAEIVYRDEMVVAFSDLYPKAPIHKLIIPVFHFSTLNEVSDEIYLGKMLIVAKNLAREYGMDEDGYRVIINCNENGGQEVYHLHMHLIGGRKLN